MTNEERKFWQHTDPAWLAAHDANEQRVKLIQGAIDDLERAQAELDLAKMAQEAEMWDGIAKDIYADIEQEMRMGEHDSGYRFTNHD